MSGYSGEPAPERVRRHLVLPATTAVPLVVQLADSPYRPPAFVMGGHDTSIALEVDCAPSYLEVLLSPWAPTASSGCPSTSSAATPWTWPLPSLTGSEYPALPQKRCTDTMEGAHR